jgi:hypothetical protein
MDKRMHVVAGVALNILLVCAGPGYAQSTSEHALPESPPASHGRAPNEEGRSRLPLVDPNVVRPGSGDSRGVPRGEPGASSGDSGQSTEKRRGRSR